MEHFFKYNACFKAFMIATIFVLCIDIGVYFAIDSSIPEVAEEMMGFNFAMLIPIIIGAIALILAIFVATWSTLTIDDRQRTITVKTYRIFGLYSSTKDLLWDKFGGAVVRQHFGSKGGLVYKLSLIYPHEEGGDVDLDCGNDNCVSSAKHKFASEVNGVWEKLNPHAYQQYHQENGLAGMIGLPGMNVQNIANALSATVNLAQNQNANIKYKPTVKCTTCRSTLQIPHNSSQVTCPKCYTVTQAEPDLAPMGQIIEDSSNDSSYYQQPPQAPPSQYYQQPPQAPPAYTSNMNYTPPTFVPHNERGEDDSTLPSYY